MRAPIAIRAERVYSAVMRYLLAALLAMIFLTGCETSAEDRAFFYSGWTHPERDAEKRLIER